MLLSGIDQHDELGNGFRTWQGGRIEGATIDEAGNLLYQPTPEIPKEAKPAPIVIYRNIMALEGIEFDRIQCSFTLHDSDIHALIRDLWLIEMNYINEDVHSYKSNIKQGGTLTVKLRKPSLLAWLLKWEIFPGTIPTTSLLPRIQDYQFIVKSILPSSDSRYSTFGEILWKALYIELLGGVLFDYDRLMALISGEEWTEDDYSETDCIPLTPPYTLLRGLLFKDGTVTDSALQERLITIAGIIKSYEESEDYQDFAGSAEVKDKLSPMLGAAFFVTESGFVGVCLDKAVEIREGDNITFYGAIPLPMITRPASLGEGDEYNFLGACRIRGWGKAELKVLLDRGLVEKKAFKIR
jgi:hypothetical protein